jgi:hypothetical protein
MPEKKDGSMMTIHAFRRRTVLLAACVSLTLFGCNTVDDLLEANNPAQIREDQLDDETLVGVLVNSVIGSLSSMYTGFIIRQSVLTDEMLYGINDEQSARLNQRIVRFDEGTAATAFSAVSRLRFLADSVTGRLRNLLPQLSPPADPGKDRRVALALAYAGYGYLLTAESECEATINVGSQIYTPKEVAELAIARFEEAVTNATAAGSSATDVLNLARTGLARAALLAGNNTKAMAAAANVPADFAWWVEYKDQIQNNGLVGNVTGANHNLGVGISFLNGTYPDQNLVATQTDPRIQHMPNWRLGHNQLTRLYTPYQSLPYSGYNGQTIATGGKPILYANDTDVKLASGVEAWHHYYEAAGPTGTGPGGTTLAFVNSRRAFGNQTAVTLSGADLMTELRNQRGKDLFLGGFRLADLRRWQANGVADLFPTGIHPNTQWGPYGDATCYPIPDDEYEGNPNIRR